jgi:hypothetical protein
MIRMSSAMQNAGIGPSTLGNPWENPAPGNLFGQAAAQQAGAPMGTGVNTGMALCSRLFDMVGD